MEGNDIVFTEESRFCLQHRDGPTRVWRHRGERLLNCCVMHHHTGPASGIMVWAGIEFHFLTFVVRIAGTLNSQRYIFELLEPVGLSYIQCLPSVIFQQVNARPHMACNVQEFFFTHKIKLLPSPACSPDLYRQSKTCGLCFHNDWPGIHHPLLHQINFGNMWKAHEGCCISMIHPKPL
ncbi:transposable element Tcb1 transposase [Trichonephila clavipes]|nr:transposable element Tcb1 transposase [Trichonephila clavipes]